MLAATSLVPPPPTGLSRRNFIGVAPLAASALLAQQRPSGAAEPTAIYTDAASGCSFAYPTNWNLEKKTLDRAQLPLVIVSNGQTPSTNAFFAVNSIRGDYANLGSFGSPADVLVNLIPPAGTPGIKSEVLASVNKGKTYEFDYTLAFDGGVTRHLRTVFGIAHSATGSDFLVTLTAQSEEQNYAAAKADLDSIMGSMRI